MGEEIEDVLQLIVSMAEHSVKMKKELKQTILDTVSTLRDLIVKLHVSRVSETDEISKLVKQVGELKAELDECRHRSAKELGTPSSEENHEPAGKSARSVADDWEYSGTSWRGKTLLRSSKQWDTQKTISTDG